MSIVQIKKEEHLYAAKIEGIARLFIEKGHNVNSNDKERKAPLQTAMNKEAARLVVEKMANTDEI